MSDKHWLLVTDITGPIGFSLSLISNSILLFLMLKKSSPVHGAYKNLLIVFCVFTLFYSSVEIWLKPLIHIYDDTLWLIYRKRIEISPALAKLQPTLYCGCYAMSFNLFALQFLFRFVAVCKPKHLHTFDGIRFVLWICGIVFIAATWQASAYIFFPKTSRTENTFKLIIRDSYNLPLSNVDYIPYRYFDYDINHIRRVNWLSFTGVVQHGIVIVFSFGILYYCGVRTFLKIRNHSGMSSKTRELQLQLFHALVVQTFIPMMFMYIPVGFMFACPYLDLQLGAITNYQTVMAQLYPGVDPFVLLLLVAGFRNALIEMVTRKPVVNRISCIPSQVQNTSPYVIF